MKNPREKTTLRILQRESATSPLHAHPPAAAAELFLGVMLVGVAALSAVVLVLPQELVLVPRQKFTKNRSEPLRSQLLHKPKSISYDVQMKTK